MPTEKKVEAVKQLRERIERAAIVIAAEYRGLSVVQLAELRRAIRDAGIEMKVVKNRLFQRAALDAERPELVDLLEGPTAVLFGYEDIAESAKAITEYARQARNAFAVRKGVMDGQLLSAADVQSLASLPPRPILAGQIAGALQAPVAWLAGLLDNLVTNAPGRLLNDSLRTFGGLLDARAKQLESA